MSKFKIGDKVICKKLPTFMLNNKRFTIGKSYEIGGPWYGKYEFAIAADNFGGHDGCTSQMGFHFELENLNSTSVSSPVTASQALHQLQTLPVPTGFVPLKTSTQSKTAKDNAKKLLEIEYSHKAFDETEINERYKTVFNLSDDEIQAILNEIENENNLNLLTPNYIGTSWHTGSSPNFIGFDEASKIDSLHGVNGNICSHKMVPYQGLFESYNHCEKCGEKEK